MRNLIQLYKISSPSKHEGDMIRYLSRIVTLFGASCSKDKAGNLYIIKGTSATYPCVVAHMDEVHSAVAKKDIKVVDDMIFGFDYKANDFTGIGADDKNGIWVAIECLKRLEAIKIAFFVGEEVGCLGSGQADMDFFDDCRFVIQCDRKGSSDFITCAGGTNLCSDEFVEACNIDSFGYSKAHGLMTDVMELKDSGLKVSACNISCGYYNPHTDTEFTHFAELQNCLKMCLHICSLQDTYPHERKYESYVKHYMGSGYYDDYPYGRYGNSYYDTKYDNYYYNRKNDLPVNDLPSDDLSTWDYDLWESVYTRAYYELEAGDGKLDRFDLVTQLIEEGTIQYKDRALAEDAFNTATQDYICGASDWDDDVRKDILT